MEYFVGSRTGSGEVQLRWRTAAEIDNFGFKLLRADDGVLTNSIQVAFVPTSLINNTGPGDTYEFTDRVPGEGTYTYWLVDVDTFGVETLHGPVVITVQRGWQIYLPIISNR